MVYVFQLFIGLAGAAVMGLILRKLFPRKGADATETTAPLGMLLEYWTYSAVLTYLFWMASQWIFNQLFAQDPSVVVLPMRSSAYFLPAFLAGLLLAGVVQEQRIKRWGSAAHPNNTKSKVGWQTWLVPGTTALIVVLFNGIVLTRIEIHPGVALQIVPWGKAQVLEQPNFEEPRQGAPRLYNAHDTLVLSDFQWEVLQDHSHITPR